jgi:uncharacterized LabA/DUF88 family protein
VTTQDIHHEHNDVDQFVVDYSSASETTTVDPTTLAPSTNPPAPDASDTPGTDTENVGEIQKGTSAVECSALVESEDASSDPIVISVPMPSHDQQIAAEAQVITPLNAAGVSWPSELPAVASQELSSSVSASSAAIQKTALHTPSGELVLAEEVPFPGEQLSSSELISEEASIQNEIEKEDQIKSNTSNIGADGQPNLDVVISATSDTATIVESVETMLITPEVESQGGQQEALSTESTPISAEAMSEESADLQYASNVLPPLSYPETHLMTDPKTEEVRSFTAFIEEFRLAEVALHESQVEAFALLNSVETNTSTQHIEIEKQGHSEREADKQQIEETSMQAEAKQPMNIEPKEAVAEERKTIVERPVSPLLRPATRLRVPRHSMARHQREEQLAAGSPPSLAQKATEAKEGMNAAASELPVSPVEPATPKPARRYRFDRPSMNGKNSSPTLSPVPTSPLPGINDTPHDGATTPPNETRANVVLHPELPDALAEQPELVVLPEVMPQEESSTPTSHQVPEAGHRHPTQKEQQPTPTPPIVEIPAMEPVPQAEEVAPEDLPPLEYAELQKASSGRRRRRHRSSSSNGASPAQSTNNTLTEPVAPPPPLSSMAPQTPLSSLPQVPLTQIPSSLYSDTTPTPTAGSVYNIVSGYTLNQMNQGKEIVGPFMGPEPSPARGSVLSRDGRTTRAETQRTPLPPPTFPSRSTEQTSSMASMMQFATIVSQAIQAQTDRMVAELRRANQAPTNVSVSLPPFPSTERVGVFVDVANLLYSARTLRIAVDFGKLLDFLRGNRRLVRAHAYCPTSPQPGDEQMFLQAVKGLGYRITTKNYKTFSSGAKKADLDLDLCMDVVRLVDGRAVDCIVLVSGDSDFMPMLDYCSDHGVRVEVAAFDEAMSATLRQSCDLFVNLSMLEEIRA